MKIERSSAKAGLLATAFVVLLAALSAFPQATPWSQNVSPLPEPTGMVNDFAGVIDAATKQQLETKLRNLRDTTDPKVEIAVAVVKTTGDRDIFDYSLAVARGWKIGTKSDDNPSALLFVAIDDRKYFTQVSKDLEDELPDGVVGSLQRQYLVPEFKKGNYGKGISDTIDAYISTVRNKGNAPIAAPTPVSGDHDYGSGSPGSGLICCGIIILFLLIFIFSRGKGGGSTGSRGGWGGGGFGNTAANVAGSALPWIIGSILSGGGSSSGGSSSSDWGSSSGGGSDWGGFGGGGDFGGGGSGGSW